MKFDMYHLYKGKETRNCKFHDLPTKGELECKIYGFIKNSSSLYFEASFRQTTCNCIVMMTKKGSTKVVSCINPGAGVLVLG